VKIRARDIRLLAGIIMGVMRAYEHRRVGEGDRRHEAVDPAVGEIHLALPHAALNGHRLCDTDIGCYGFDNLERVHVGGADRIAAVPVKADKLAAQNQRCAVCGGLAQPCDEIHRQGVVIIVTYLKTGLVDMPSRRVQYRLADLPMRAGVACDDPGLRHWPKQSLQPLEIIFRQAGPDQHHEIEIGIGLRHQPGQAQVFEKRQPALHPFGRIKIGATCLDALVNDLESALGRIGETAKKNGLHNDCTCLSHGFAVYGVCNGAARHTSVGALLTTYPTPHIRAPNSAGFRPVCRFTGLERSRSGRMPRSSGNPPHRFRKGSGCGLLRRPDRSGVIVNCVADARYANEKPARGRPRAPHM